MNLIGVAKFMVISAVIVLSLFAGIALLVMSKDSREDLRYHVKHRIYVSQVGFNVLCKVAGIVLLFVGFLTSIWIVSVISAD